jgi:hypothetical protein
MLGGAEFARRVLLLESGYLNNSLGHSVSCTVFILLEMLERKDQDFWQSLSVLADYFESDERDDERDVGSKAFFENWGHLQYSL